MTYQASTMPAGTRIVKGPSKIDLLEAMFFDSKKILCFNTESVGQIFCYLHGLVRLPDQPQFYGLLISYNPTKNSRVGATMTYDCHNREGFITRKNEVMELFNLTPYNDHTS